MKYKGPFVSIPNEIDIVGESPSTLPDVDTLKSMAYLGQSISHRIYWNKAFPSSGLLCGSSVGNVNSVARLFVSSHLEKEPGAQTCPRVLVFHAGNHMVHKASPALLDMKDTTILVSPRIVQSTTQAIGRHAPQPLRFSEDDLSLHHVLAFFSPPPEMHPASASRILTTVQYVISQLPTDGPFDLQTFIQLIEQEKWDDEGSTFIALRQTLLTGLLASYQDDFENNSAQLPLNSLDKVMLDLTDPILCSTRLDGVLMDMALHAFLKPSADQNEKTMIILSAADEYLHASSPLLRSLRSLASEERRNISVLVMTTNLPSFALLPGVFDAMDYVALAGPVRSSTWLGTIRTHFISTGFPESPPMFLSRNMLAVISPDSQLLESIQDGERWTSWGDGCICAKIDESLSVTSLWAVANDVLKVAEETRVPDLRESGDDMSISDASHFSQRQSVETRRPKSTTERDGREDIGAVITLEPSTIVLSVPIPIPSPEILGIGLGQSSLPDFPPPPPNRESSLPRQRVAIKRDNDSGSDDSSGEEGSSEVGMRPIDSIGDFFHNGTLLRRDLIPFFRIKSDLPPEAFIKASVEVSMYPDTFKLLTTTILRLSAGYSNVGVVQKEIGAIIRPFMKQMKDRGSPLPFKNFNKMMKRAWSSHIVRNSTKENMGYVFLVNTQNAIDRLNLRGASGTGELSRNTITRAVSPYLPLVNSIARLAGKQAFVPAPFKLVRKEMGGEVKAKSLGFSEFLQCVTDASALGLVTKQGTGKNRTLSLRADWNHLQSLLVLRPDASDPPGNVRRIS